METGGFQLKWNNYHSAVTNMLRNLWVNGAYIDVSIACGTHILKAHRNVLSACSTYFENVLMNMPSNQYPVIIMRGVSVEDMQSVLDFVYTGQVSVPQSKLDDFLRLAEDLGLHGLSHNLSQTFNFMDSNQVQYSESQVPTQTAETDMEILRKHHKVITVEEWSDDLMEDDGHTETVVTKEEDKTDENEEEEDQEYSDDTVANSQIEIVTKDEPKGNILSPSHCVKIEKGQKHVILGRDVHCHYYGICGICGKFRKDLPFHVKNKHKVRLSLFNMDDCIRKDVPSKFPSATE